jgi:hypothetical protein
MADPRDISKPEDLPTNPDNLQRNDGLISPIEETSSSQTPPTLPPNDVSQQVDSSVDGNDINISGETPPDSFGGSPITGASEFPLAGSFPMGEGTPNGVFSVPRCGSRVWVFFHGGDIQKPVYFAYSLAPTDHYNFYGNPPPQPDEQKSSLPATVQPDNQSSSQELIENPLPTQTPEPTQTVRPPLVVVPSSELEQRKSTIDQYTIDKNTL